IIETVAAVLLAHRVQQALLFPEMQRRDTHTHLFGRLSYSQSLWMGGVRLLGGLPDQWMQGSERLLDLETFVSQLCVSLVDRRKRCRKVAPMKRLHNRRCSGPAVATNHTFYCLECSQMLLRVETIAARTPLCLRNQATGLIIAHLLHTHL